MHQQKISVVDAWLFRYSWKIIQEIDKSKKD